MIANIYQYFSKSVHERPNEPCLIINQRLYSYADVEAVVNKIAHVLLSINKQRPVGILAHRSLSAYAGILAALKTGLGYVPLNPRFPVNRNESIFALSGINTIVADASCFDYAEQFVQLTKCNIIFPEERLEELPLSNNAGKYFTIEHLKVSAKISVQAPDRFAYLLFTSGSTGVPKGVPVSHNNVISYVAYIMRSYNLSYTDRFSQLFDLTFDLSVHDMFVCWAVAGALCIPNKGVISPVRYIQDNKLTVWFSVPSLIHYMNRSRALKTGAFSSIRQSFFCGEALQADITHKWQLACPNAQIVNIYGPTEATIGCSHYKWDAINFQNNKVRAGYVSIGKIFDTQSFCIIDSMGNSVEQEQEGELCISGSQVVEGYWKNNEETAKKFIQLPGAKDRVWYKTGDVVVQDEEGDIFFVSRTDFQIKIKGYRVELNEINTVIKRFTNATLVISIGYKPEGSMMEGICSFIEGPAQQDVAAILNYCRLHLPDYMIPDGIIFLDEFPLNYNGKIDRNVLHEYALNKFSTL